MTGFDLRADELLRIDYVAERRRLGEATLDAAFRLPAELVRRALRAGASRVAMETAPHGLRVLDDGREPTATLREAHQLWRDPGASDAARHRALRTLEAEPGLLMAGPRAELDRTGQRTRVVVPGFTLDRAGRTALVDALRFCPVPVELDGRALPRGFDAAIAVGDIPPPLRGAVALARAASGDVALVLEGVVAARVSLPDAPPLLAWVDVRSLGAVIPEPPVAARLRAALEPHAASLAAAALELALGTAKRLDAMGTEGAEAVLEALLVAARRGPGQRGEILAAPVVPAIVAGARCFCSLSDLGREAQADPARSVAVLDPGAEPAAFLLPDTPVFVLSPEARAQVAALLGVRFRKAPTRDSQVGPLVRLRRRAGDVRRACLRGVALLRHPGSGRPLSDAELQPHERALLRGLGAGVALTTGAGPVRQVVGEWRLPRHNDLVAAAARAVAADPRWVHPAALSLFEGRRAAPAAWAEAWVNPTGAAVPLPGARP